MTAAPKKPVDIVLAVCYDSIDTRQRRPIVVPSKKSERPYTKEELAEALAKVPWEKAEIMGGEWVAYCTYCGAAVEVNYNPRIVETVALIHTARNPKHQVVVGKEILGRSYAVGVEP